MNQIPKSLSAPEWKIGSSYTESEAEFTESDFRASDHVFENHMLVAGGTQRGKSYFLEMLIRRVSRHAGVVLFDPHGELAERLRDYFVCFPGLWDRVIYFDINDPDVVMGYDPFRRREGIETDKQVELIMEACLRANEQESYAETPTLDRRLYSMFEILLRTGHTFIEAMDMVSMERDEKRDAIVELARQAGVEDFFLEDWEAIKHMRSRREKRDELLSSLNRIRRIVASETGRLIFGQRGERSLDLLDVINNRKILLINAAGRNVSKRLGKLLSALMMNEIYNLFPLRNRKSPPAYVVIDEFSKIGTPTVEDGLDETHKFNLYWVLATQHLTQIDKVSETLYGSVMANTHVKVAFGGMDMPDCEALGNKMFASEIARQMKAGRVKWWREKQWAVQRWITETTKTVGENISNSEGGSDVTSTGGSESESRGISLQRSKGVSADRSQGGGSSVGISGSNTTTVTEGTSEQWGEANSRAHTESVQDSRTVGSAHTDGHSSSSAASSSAGSNTAYPRDGAGEPSVSYQEGTTSSESSGAYHSDTQNISETQGRGSSDQVSESQSHNTGVQKSKANSASGGVNISQSVNWGNADRRNLGLTEGKNRNMTKGENWNNTQGKNWNQTKGTQQSISQTEKLLTEHETRLEPGETYTLAELQFEVHAQLEALPQQFAALKVDGHPAQIIKIRNVIGADGAEISEVEKTMFDEHNRSRPFFHEREDAEQHIREHNQNLLLTTPPNARLLGSSSQPPNAVTDANPFQTKPARGEGDVGTDIPPDDDCPFVL